jgi:hypothetical protein
MRCDMSVAHYVLAVYFEHAATDQVCHSHAKEIHQARQQAGFGPASEVGPADRALPGANGDVGLLSQDAS